MKRKLTILALVFLSTLSLAGRAVSQTRPPADRAIQHQIESAVSSTLPMILGTQDWASTTKLPEVQWLEVLFTRDFRNLFTQSVLYEASLSKRDVRSRAQLTSIRRIRSRFCEQAPLTDVIVTVVCLQDFEDQSTRSIALDSLTPLFGRDREKQFSAFSEAVEVSPYEDAFKIAVYMYGLDPHLGFRALSGRLENDIAIHEEDVAIANAEFERMTRARFGKPDEETSLLIAADLKELNGESRWWVRLYIVTLLKKHRGLRVPELVDPLLADTNLDIRAIAESIPGYERYRRIGPPPERGSPEAHAETMERIRYLEEQGAFLELHKKTAEYAHENN